MQQKTNPQPNFDLLRDAYAIIDGIPAKILKLDRILHSEGASPACGTVACAFGFLSLHQQFQELGLSNTGEGSNFLNINGESLYWEVAVCRIFNLSGAVAANDVFSSRGFSKYDLAIFKERGERVSDKELWKARVIAFLKEHNQPINPEVLQ